MRSEGVVFVGNVEWPRCPRCHNFVGKKGGKLRCIFIGCDYEIWLKEMEDW